VTAERLQRLDDLALMLPPPSSASLGSRFHGEFDGKRPKRVVKIIEE
jgi:hypothetical protein